MITEQVSKMLTNLELYGTEDVPSVPAEICNERLRLLEIHMRTLLDVHYMKQDNQTMNSIIKAQKFWTQLKDGEEPT